MSYSLAHPARARFPVKATIGLLAVANILPLLIHLIPSYSGTSVGGVLLPMFYIPLVALLFLHLRVALVVAVLAPLTNYLITGLPQGPFALLLSIELILFTLLTGRLLRSVVVAWVAAPVAFVLAKVVSASVLAVIPLLPQLQPWDYLSGSIRLALPGVVLLWVVNGAALSYQQHR